MAYTLHIPLARETGQMSYLSRHYHRDPNVWLLIGWDGGGPEYVTGIDAAMIAAEARASREGASVHIAALHGAHADSLVCQTVSPDGHWSHSYDEPLPGSLSEIDTNDAGVDDHDTRD